MSTLPVSPRRAAMWRGAVVNVTWPRERLCGVMQPGRSRHADRAAGPRVARRRSRSRPSTGRIRIRCTSACGPRRRSGTTRATTSSCSPATPTARRCCGTRDGAATRRTSTRAVATPDDVRLALGDLKSGNLLFLDPPDHTRLRRLVSKAFTPRSIEQLRPHVHELVDGMLDELRDAGRDRPDDAASPTRCRSRSSAS